jgi:hypothetical protein
MHSAHEMIQRISTAASTRRRGLLSLVAAALIPAGVTEAKQQDRPDQDAASESCEPTGRRCDSKKNRGRPCAKCCTRYSIRRRGQSRCACRPNGMKRAARGDVTCCSGRSHNGVCIAEGVQCLQDSECTGSTDRCSNGICTCGGDPCSGICSSGVCLACSTSAECGEGLVCLEGQCGIWTLVSTIGQYNSSSSDADSFDGPEDVILSSDKRTMFVADANNDRISIWTRANATSQNWNPSTFIPEENATAGSADDELDDPQGLFLSSDDLILYIGDFANDRVVVWTRQTATDTVWTFHSKFGGFGTNGSAPQDMESNQGIFVSPDNLRAYVSSSGTTNSNSRVMVWTRSSATATDWAWAYNVPGDGTGIDGDGPAEFERTYDVDLIDNELTMYVTDIGNNRISVWTRTSIANTNTWQHAYNFGTVGESSNQLSSPEAIAFSSDLLTTFVADQNNDRVAIWTRDSATSSDWTPALVLGPLSTSLLENPSGINTPDGGRTLYVADASNQRIAVFAFTASGA